jgi:transposase
MATPSASSGYRLFVGVDIAATSAAASWMAPSGRPTRSITIDQTMQGYASLQKQLLATGVAPSQILVVLEATGTYWVMLATTLHNAGFAVAVINPAQAHDFAKALLKRSKTDAIDAQTLAELGARLQPERWTPPPAIYAELQQRLAQREALIEFRQQLRNQLHALIQQPVVIASVRARMETLITTLTEQIAEVDGEIASALNHDAAWAEAARRLQTIPGIGLLTAVCLLVVTLNFTLCQTPEQAVSYAGLAPREWRSGSSVRGRPRIGHTGNGRLRRMLYLASLSATRYNPLIKPFYQRLRAAGKPAKVAQCAAARKLLHLAWAVVSKEQDFDPTYSVGDQQQERAAA